MAELQTFVISSANFAPLLNYHYSHICTDRLSWQNTASWCHTADEKCWSPRGCLACTCRNLKTDAVLYFQYIQILGLIAINYRALLLSSSTWWAASYESLLFLFSFCISNFVVWWNWRSHNVSDWFASNLSKVSHRKTKSLCWSSLLLSPWNVHIPNYRAHTSIYCHWRRSPSNAEVDRADLRDECWNQNDYASMPSLRGLGILFC